MVPFEDMEMNNPEEEEVVVLEDGDPDEDLIFMLPQVPGAPEAGEIVVMDETPSGDIEVEDESDAQVEVVDDPWDWQSKGPRNFLNWLANMISNVPKHSGYDTTGLEKAISYFEILNKEISKAMRQDFKDEIDAAKAEKARDEIERGIDRLVERLERVKSTKYPRKGKKVKKGWAEELGLIKEAQRATRIDGITITVPLIISTIARICINGMVSAGHDLEDMFEKQAKIYNLDNREKAELAQLLSDMGYAMRRDRGIEVGKDWDPTQSDNFDMNANYQG